MAEFNGTPGNDTYNGTDEDDVINGNDGDDRLSGGRGNDTINGGNGNDYLSGGAGADIVDGGAGDDYLAVSLGETVAGDRFIGGSGIDTLFAGSQTQFIDLTVVTIDDDIELLTTIWETRLTLAQLNQFQGVQGGLRIVDSGTIDLTGNKVTGASGFNLANGTNYFTLAGNVLGDQVSVTGGNGIDTIIGSQTSDRLIGGAGDDVLEGRGGDDELIGDDGDDVMLGGDGNDSIRDGLGADIIDGGNGDDTVYLDFQRGFSGLDQVSGGTGTDTLNFTFSTFGTIDLGTLNIADDFERLNGNSANLMISIERLNRFQSVTVTAITLTTGGNFTLSNAVKSQRFTLSDFGNVIDLSAGGQGSYDVVGGTGNDTIIGTAYTDTFTGGAGDDVIRGSGGSDDLSGGSGVNTLDGGTGDDVLRVEVGAVVAAGSRFTGGAGTDTLFVNGPTSGSTAIIADLTSAIIDVDIERLRGGTLAGASLTASQLSAFSSVDLNQVYVTTAGSIDLTGKSFIGTLNLSDFGNMVIFSGSTRGYTVVGGAGVDMITGGDASDNLSGGGGDDVILGRGGDDVINGGAGLDQLYGSTGNDTYYTDQQGDLVFENAGEGTDTVISTSNFYLYANIENLTLAAGAGNIFGVGNELANTILGNEGNNMLLGGGGVDTIRAGAGVDIVYGEAGNDQLFGDAGNDFLAGGIGDDTIDGGEGGDSLYGDDGNDTLTGGSDFVFDQLVGGSGDDVLRGDSGLGDYDYLYGNTGNDSFYVDTPADLVFEQAGEGTDTVYASINGGGYYLYDNIENLVLLGNTPFGVGNGLANTLIGNGQGNYLLGGGGDDVLNGKGGYDVLFGEAGADLFVFERGTGGDVIGDFVAGTDRIDLSAFGFANYQAVINSMHENAGTTAIDLGGGDFIVLNGVAASQLRAGDFILSAAQSAIASDPAIDRLQAAELDGEAAGQPVWTMPHNDRPLVRFGAVDRDFDIVFASGGPLVMHMDGPFL